ncbi:MAG: carboxypeptidase regulatory-like domain-containing protein, partial [Vicinamibacteria bacterium]|nr:carboxypeptidase regulatory-like domain-containing protein [Vicinamibacteria bacterium]
MSRRLGALGLPLGEETTLPQFLSALRGARVEVRRGAVAVTGRLLDVESKNRVRDGAVEEVNQISVVTEGGEVHAVDLGAGTVLRFADPVLNQRVNRYLEMVASSRDQDRRSLTIDASGAGTRRLYASYVSEVPVWKTTYRIILPDDAAAKPRLQGWALIDNTVGDDWTDVELSLVAGAPQSFIQPLSQPLYTRRPQVPMASGFMLSPQTHAETLIAGGAAGRVVDSSGAVLPGASVRVYDAAGQLVGSTVTNAEGRFSVPG